MKKIVMTVAAVTMVITGALSVSAAEVATNMDAETFVEIRTAQVEEAHDAGDITDAEYQALLTHIEDTAGEEDFGHGPSNGSKGDGNAVCELGEDRELGIFSSASAGNRTGEGNGVGIQSQDGSGSGNGNQSNGQGSGFGNGSGNGLKDGSATGMGNRNQADDCLLED